MYLRLFITSVAIWWAHLGAVAQLAGTPPQCALACFVSVNYQGCATADTSCLCTNPTAVTGVQACIQKQCTSASNRSAAIAFGQQECQSLAESSSGSGAPISTQTVSSASEATGASSGNGASPSLRLSLSFFSPTTCAAALLVLAPVLGAIIEMVA